MSERLTWRKQPSETGLAAVCQGPRGCDLRRAGKSVIHVRPLVGAHRYEVKGWCWYTMSDDLPRRNTASTPTATMEEAKAEALAFARQHLAEKAHASF